MNNIIIIKKGIDVSKVVEQLEEYSDDWYIQRKGTDTLLERGYADIEVGNLQLIMGAIKKKEDFVGDSELNKPTPAYQRHTEILKIIKSIYSLCLACQNLPQFREPCYCNLASCKSDKYFSSTILTASFPRKTIHPEKLHSFSITPLSM